MSEITNVAGLPVIAAGFVRQDGIVLRKGGRPFNVRHLSPGRYEVIFNEVLDATPVVVAITDGGDAGCFAEIQNKFITGNGFIVEGRDYAGHGLADIGFHFVVVKLD
jgi:hypothetical protein